jgi:hypothetical protein
VAGAEDLSSCLCVFVFKSFEVGLATLLVMLAAT